MEPGGALLRATSEYEILFRWSGLDLVDKVGARLPELVVLPTMSPLRGSKGYCRLPKGEFSDNHRTGVLENERTVKHNIFIYEN